MSRTIAEDVSFIRETMAVMAARVEDLHKTINGNGKPGLKAEFERHKWLTYIGFILLASGGTASGLAFFNMLKTIFTLGNP